MPLPFAPSAHVPWPEHVLPLDCPKHSMLQDAPAYPGLHVHAPVVTLHAPWREQGVEAPPAHVTLQSLFA